MTDLNDFGDDLKAVQTDSKLQWASVVDATPESRQAFYDAVDPADDGARDDGLAIEFETAGGQTFNRWYDRPEEWNRMNNLVLLLDYWTIDPAALDVLAEGSDEEYEVPIQIDEGTGEWHPDWVTIEKKIRDREVDDAE